MSVDIKSEIEQKNELFALPESVAKILKLASNEDVGVDELAEVISSDPALTGRLIKVANSPFYGLNQRVQSIHSAIMALGMTTVKCLALSVSLFNLNKISNDLGIDVKALYGNIFAVATSCNKLAVACKFPSPDEAFICGLLYDIGFLYYLQNYPEYSKSVINFIKSGHDWIREEKKIFGISHAEAGGLIAQQWRLPEQVCSAISNHHSFGFKDSDTLDDIVRLGVALNFDLALSNCNDVEEKVAKIAAISDRLEIDDESLNDIAAASLNEAIQFAQAINIDIGDSESLLSRANNEIFKTYMSIHNLFRERQELTKNILNEERQKGISEAKQIAISTLSHYINNSSMIISGQSQVLRLMLKHKTPDEIISSLDKALDVIDSAIRKTVAVLEEISDLNMLDDVEYFDQSKILNIDDRINERVLKLKEMPGPSLKKLPVGN